MEKIIKQKKEVPKLFENKNECCGCGACYAICPMSGPDRPQKARITEKENHTGAITMKPDEEGFLYPVIDAEICIRCFRCIEVCPQKREKENRI
ncbi:MAG: 4Fe-4S dicluster domain-containing protein [Ruminococcus sp.]|nr:4Fe-4S dicluster domain-containing protein [Ruminococcus sp.]